MKGKNFTNSSSYFHEAFQIRCWRPVKNSKQAFLKRLIRRYQKTIDTTFSITIIGTMFLIGIWCFLVQLAEY
jgi:hypothetical protein